MDSGANKLLSEGWAGNLKKFTFAMLSVKKKGGGGVRGFCREPNTSPN
jgi:hypothetical protein